jgi:hypothetical protein
LVHFIDDEVVLSAMKQSMGFIDEAADVVVQCLGTK